MAFSSALFLPLLMYVGVFSLEFTMTEEKACSVKRNGTLTMFNGERIRMKLPCKYRLSDCTCGDYRVKVTPGSAIDKDYSHRFSPDTVWVKVVNTKTGASLEIRTSVKRMDKKLFKPWQVKSGSVSVVDFAGYDQLKAAAVLRKDDVFSVEFSSAERSVVVTCSDEKCVPKGLPEALCGDGTTTDAMKTAITTLFPGQKDMTDDAFVTYVVLNHDNVVQRSTCKDLASKFTSCEDKEQAAMKCVAIFGDQAECLAGSDTSLRDYYADCLKYVCDADTSALEPMNNYINDNCDVQKYVMCGSEGWSGSRCGTNEDCGVSNAKCYGGGCNCLLGFFYSERSRCCVKTCSQINNRFDTSGYSQTYAVATITSDAPVIDKARYTGVDAQDKCFAPCAANSSCLFLTIDYSALPYECTLYSDVTVTTAKPNKDNLYLYTRWCV